jgi:hypothetical protein
MERMIESLLAKIEANQKKDAKLKQINEEQGWKPRSKLK